MDAHFNKAQSHVDFGNSHVTSRSCGRLNCAFPFTFSSPSE
jgi:hypothetical protein